jgi:hypothetical protein
LSAIAQKTKKISTVTSGDARHAAARPIFIFSGSRPLLLRRRAVTLLAYSSGTPRWLKDGGALVRQDFCAVVFLLVWPRNGVVMSMQPRPWPDVPDLTARMARLSSRKAKLAMRIRDELGEVYADARFAAARPDPPGG